MYCTIENKQQLRNYFNARLKLPPYIVHELLEKVGSVTKVLYRKDIDAIYYQGLTNNGSFRLYTWLRCRYNTQCAICGEFLTNDKLFTDSVVVIYSQRLSKDNDNFYPLTYMR